MKISLYYFFVILFATCSCSYRQVKNTSPEINSLWVDEKFTINLPEIHSDGYNWMLQNDYDPKLLKDLGAVWHGEQKGTDFNFKTLGVGRTTLTFVKRKYTDTAAIQQYILEIIDK